MKKYIISFILIIPVIQLLAQLPISTIDNVFIERDTVIKNVVTTQTFELDETIIRNGDVILFDIPGVGEYMVEKQIPLSNVTLIIQDIPLPELHAFILNMESGTIRVGFSEKFIQSENRQKLYQFSGGELKELRLGIKIGEELKLNYYPNGKFYFETIRNWRLLGLVLIAFFVAFFILLIFRYKSMVKDNLESFVLIDVELSEAKIKEEEKELLNQASYSFGKSQMAYWSFIIVSSFIYIWALTGDLQSINTTALILLGISAATISTSGLIAHNEETNASSGDAKKSLQKNRTTSHYFLKDILSDSDGVSIHRFQALVFNVVFGIAFFKSVIWDYTMPDFSDTQLILLGLSNGTYAFMKNSENKHEKKEKK